MPAMKWESPDVEVREPESMFPYGSNALDDSPANAGELGRGIVNALLISFIAGALLWLFLTGADFGCNAWRDVAWRGR